MAVQDYCDSHLIHEVCSTESHIDLLEISFRVLVNNVKGNSCMCLTIPTFN